MIRRPPRSPRTDPLFPYTTLVRSPRRGLVAISPATQPQRSVRPWGTPAFVRPLQLHIRPGPRPLEYSGCHRSVAATRHKASLFCPIRRSEEHTSELQSLMRISYAVFCLTKKKLESYTAPTIRTTPRTCITKIK